LTIGARRVKMLTMKPVSGLAYFYFYYATVKHPPLFRLGRP